MPVASESLHDSGHTFFDPRNPEIPADVLGIPSDPLINLTKALGSVILLTPSGSIPYSTSHGVYVAGRSAENALRLFPLVERIQAGEPLSAEDIRPYRKPIKRLVPKLSVADKWAAFSGGLIFGIPLRKALNRRIEKEFPKRVPRLLEQAVEYTPLVEPYVKFFEQFDDPREQFVSEVELVATGIRQASLDYAGRHSRNVNTVNASDAAEGIRQTIRKILADPETPNRMPVLHHLVFEQAPKDTSALDNDNLGVIAPEIIRALELALPEKRRDTRFLSSITYNQHPKRWLAEKFKSHELYSANDIAEKLLPSIRDLLPTDGREVRNMYARVNNFLRSK